jgi:16S rRNA C1402 (ribose-2'-O) methylase RsmI
LNLFAAKVMPALKADQAARDAKKQAELAPFIAAALKRKKRLAPVAPAAVPVVSAYGRTIVQENQTADGPTHHIAADITVMMDDPAEKKNKEAARVGFRRS